MKKIVLLGDSLRLGYDRYVRELLAGRAEVWSPDENCRFAGYMFVSMPAWAAACGKPEEVSLVHWNCGHWDCAHFDDSPEAYSTVEEYAAWLLRVHKAIAKHFPRAKIVFATSTLVDMTQYPTMPNRRSNDELRAYNGAAVKVMEGLGVPVNDLAAVSAAFPSSYYADAVHMNDQGNMALAKRVADEISQYLE